MTVSAAPDSAHAQHPDGVPGATVQATCAAAVGEVEARGRVVRRWLLEAVAALARAHAAGAPSGRLGAESFRVGASGGVELFEGAPQPPFRPPDVDGDRASRDVFAVAMLARVVVAGPPSDAASERAWRALNRRDASAWPRVGATELLPRAWVAAFDRCLGPASGRPTNAVVLRALLSSAPNDPPPHVPEPRSAVMSSSRAAPALGVADAPASSPRVRLPSGRVIAVALLLCALAAAGIAWSLRPAVAYEPVCADDGDCAAGLSCVGSFCVASGMAYVPPGAFTAGPSPGQLGGRHQEQFDVNLTRGFYVQKYEVTQAAWRELMGSEPAWFTACGDDCPVDSVNWYDAVAYANALSARDGLPACYELRGCRGTPGGGCHGPGPDALHGCDGDFVCDEVVFAGLDCGGYRLPTEAEWERAARAGSCDQSHSGPLRRSRETWDEDRAHHATVARIDRGSDVAYAGGWPCKQIRRRRQDGTCGPAPVGSLAPNDLGLHDVLGNMSEWTHDTWRRGPPESDGDCVRREIGPDGASRCAQGTFEDPTRFEPSGPRACRGGAWAHAIPLATASSRFGLRAEHRFLDLGFRLVRTAVPPE